MSVSEWRAGKKGDHLCLHLCSTSASTGIEETGEGERSKQASNIKSEGERSKQHQARNTSTA
jgi:hypothetical protein